MIAFYTSQTLSASFQVVLDLGRRPEARFLGDGGGDYLREEEVRRVCIKDGMSRRVGVYGALEFVKLL